MSTALPRRPRPPLWWRVVILLVLLALNAIVWRSCWEPAEYWPDPEAMTFRAE